MDTDKRGDEPGDPIPDVIPPTPEPERWEPEWGPQDDEAMREWARRRPRGPLPECFRRTFKAMQAAIEREKDRRHAIGDTRSITRFEDERQRLLGEAKLLTSPGTASPGSGRSSLPAWSS
jgi:hypothetical protein